MKKDLGRGRFASWYYELSGLENEIQHAVDNIEKWSAHIDLDTPMLGGPAKSKIVYEPLGVVCVMGSWNFPFYTTIAPLIYVIAAGNCAIIKPSEISPNSSRMIKQLIEQSLDFECYICIEGGSEIA